MADTVFDSYLKSVYGGGSGLEYFDAVRGGYDLDIFGGFAPAEIFGGEDLLEVEDLSEPPAKPKQCSEESPCANGDDRDVASIIGYIQIGVHTTPIVGEGAEANSELLSPMQLAIDMPATELTAAREAKKVETDSVGPVEVGQMLLELDLSV